MKKKDQLRLAQDIYSRLEGALGHERHFSEYIGQSVKEERDHRRYWKPADVKAGLSVNQAARILAVQAILQFRAFERKSPDPADIFHVRLSVFQAWAIWKVHKKAIRQAVSMSDAKAFLSYVSYPDLMAS